MIYDDIWFEPSYVASRLVCTRVGTIPLYSKTCLRKTLCGEVLAGGYMGNTYTLCIRLPVQLKKVALYLSHVKNPLPEKIKCDNQL